MNVVAGILAKKAFSRLKDKDIQTNSENPYTEKVPVHNARGEVIKYKEKERPVPEGLSTNDQNILKKVRRKAYKWDMSFRFCCFKTRFGWSFFIGLIPFIGDVADLLVALYIVKAASKVDGGLPKTLYARMMWNISLDFGIGLIPVVGDLADALYRANTRNAWLLDAYLTEKAKALQTGKVEDPESGNTVAVPGQLSSAGGPRRTDLEMGTGQKRMDTQRGRSTRK